VTVACLKIHELEGWGEPTNILVPITDFEWDFNLAFIIQRENNEHLPQMPGFIVLLFL
jgi:hypothetical protein